MAIQMALLLLIATLGVMAISYIHITSLIQLATIFLVLTLLQIFIFFFEYKDIF